MPELQWQGRQASTVSEKAEALRARFYPSRPADLTDLQGNDFSRPVGEIITDNLTQHNLCQTITAEEVYRTLRRVKPDKCPGKDEILNRFLKAMGDPFIQALTELINACWRMEYFPGQLKQARIIVLKKPGKSDYSEPGAWRPIDLLNNIEKVMEPLMA